MKPFNPKTLLTTAISVGVVLLLINNSINKSEPVVPPIPSAPTETSESAEKTAASPTNEIPAPKTANQVKVIAAGAFLMDTAEPLYSFRLDKQWPIASLTKLMTALVAKRLVAKEETVTMTKEAAASFGEAGNFKEGEKFRAGDLIQAMLVASSNDAAKALADHYGEEALVAEMNRLAAAISMTNTSFVDATGLSSQNLSTPDDLAKLVRFIWHEDPGIFNITRIPHINIVDINGNESRKLNNTNVFVSRNDFLGGKTGQLPDSNGNLISIFKLPDQSSPVVIIILGAEDRFEETKKILNKL